MLIPRQSSLIGLLGAMLVAAVCETSRGQPASASVRWQVSLDYINWFDDITITQPTQQVQVRALLSYMAPAEYSTRFALAMCDPTVTGRNGAGPSDSIAGIHYRRDNLMMPSYGEYVGTRVNGVLKIDRASDTLPPGLGPGWVVGEQMSPAFGVLADDFPVIVLYQYALMLDGSAGVRDIAGAFRPLSGPLPNNNFIRVWAPGAVEGWIAYPVTTQVLPAHIRVDIPAPATCGMALALAGLCAARRRRHVIRRTDRHRSGGLALDPGADPDPRPSRHQNPLHGRSKVRPPRPLHQRRTPQRRQSARPSDLQPVIALLGVLSMYSRRQDCSRLFVLSVLGSLALSACAHAQPSSARLTWQMSEDQVNWTGSRYVTPGTTRVQVRALLTYLQPSTHFTRFGLSQCDPTITGQNGAGLGDTVEGIYWRYNVDLLLNYNEHQATRFGNVLKIDRVTDTAAPGAGTGWMTSFQDAPSLFPLTDDLPVIVLYQYTLVLDDTPGVREVNGVFRNQSSTVPNAFVRVWAPNGVNQWFNYPVATEVVPLLIGVSIPSPATGAVLALAGFLSARRRRSRGERSICSGSNSEM
jgi:hypothetical protein